MENYGKQNTPSVRFPVVIAAVSLFSVYVLCSGRIVVWPNGLDVVVGGELFLV